MHVLTTVMITGCMDKMPPDKRPSSFSRITFLHYITFVHSFGITTQVTTLCTTRSTNIFSVVAVY